MPRLRGTRSSRDSVEEWMCRRGYINRPEIHELFDTPTLTCGCGCREEYVGDFDFCMGDVKVNGYGVLGNPKVQGQEDECVPTVYAKQMEVCKRMKALIKGQNPDHVPVMQANSLTRALQRIVGTCQLQDGATQVIQMGRILKEEGIVAKGSKSIYRASNVSVINRNDTAGIVRALADGHPLNAGVLCGRRLTFLRYCQRYKPPRLARFLEMMQQNRRKFILAHCVLLVGAGRKKGKMYYYFLNSWKRFCARRNSCGKLIRHGIGKIAADRMYRNVIRLSRFKEAPSNMSLVQQDAPVTMDCPNVNLVFS